MYDGENATGVMLGVFNASHPPPTDGIYSSSNRIFVIFKSDKNGSYTGFDASYYGFNSSGKSCYIQRNATFGPVVIVCLKLLITV